MTWMTENLHTHCVMLTHVHIQEIVRLSVSGKGMCVAVVLNSPVIATYDYMYILMRLCCTSVAIMQ